MRHLPQTLLAVLSLAALSASAFAMPLSQYNLILFDDYDYHGGEVEGRTLIGGHLNADGQSPVFGTRLPGLPDTDALTVGKNVNAQHINLKGGNLVYGGSLNANVNFNSGEGVVSAVHTPGLSVAGIQQALNQSASDYAALGSNGSFAAGELLYDGADSLAVFSLDASDVFAANTSLKLFSGGAETVIINVAGTQIVAGGGVNLTGNGFQFGANTQNVGARNILWNFYEAETIDFNNLAMVGSVLAPYAHISGGAVFDGSVAAMSYTGAREFHQYTFIPPTVTVPEPSALLILLAGLCWIAVVRRRFG